MSNNPLQLSPLAQEAAQQAAAKIHLAANTPANGYRLVYFTTPGCGSWHNYDNLTAAQRLVPVEYVNWGHPGQTFAERDSKGRLPPGTSKRFEVGTVYSMTHSNTEIHAEKTRMAIGFLKSIGLDLIEVPRAVLVNPQGRPVHEFKSTTDAGFLAELQRYLPHAPQQARGAQRS